MSARASGEWVGGDESVAVESSVKGFELRSGIEWKSEGVRTSEFFKTFCARELITFYDLIRMEAHDQQMFRFLQQLSGKDDDHVRRISHLDEKTRQIASVMFHVKKGKGKIEDF